MSKLIKGLLCLLAAGVLVSAAASDANAQATPKSKAAAKPAAKKESGKKGTPGAPQLLRTMVGADEIAEGVARATGIPVSKLMQGERD